MEKVYARGAFLHMKVLLITTAFPPDSGIATVRPFMFAKYLAQSGHQVTVLRLGKIYNTADRTRDYTRLGIRVFSCLGENCEAERFMRGEKIEPGNEGSRKMNNLPEKLRKPLAWIYRRLYFFQMLHETQERLKLQKAWIQEHRKEHFDVVFATYSNLENVYAGQYAAQVFGCKWIVDFRDPIATRESRPLWEYPIMNRIQSRAIWAADACTTVSDDLADQLSKKTGKPVITLYNGFDEASDVENMPVADEVLRFVYTGMVYGDRDASSLFRAIRLLSDANKIDLDNVRFEYAGPHFMVIEEQAKRYAVEQILVDHGYVARDKAYEIQKRSDVFVVLSWNTLHERGVLTGKFYEGIRARKPILALIAGDQPGSELQKLNRKYRYGYCHEMCSEESSFPELCNWIAQAYANRQAGKCVDYQPDEGLFTDFRYDVLTRKLERIMLEIGDSGKE